MYAWSRAAELENSGDWKVARASGGHAWSGRSWRAAMRAHDLREAVGDDRHVTLDLARRHVDGLMDGLVRRLEVGLELCRAGVGRNAGLRAVRADEVTELPLPAPEKLVSTGWVVRKWGGRRRRRWLVRSLRTPAKAITETDAEGYEERADPVVEQVAVLTVIVDDVTKPSRRRLHFGRQ